MDKKPIKSLICMVVTNENRAFDIITDALEHYNEIAWGKWVPLDEDITMQDIEQVLTRLQPLPTKIEKKKENTVTSTSSEIITLRANILGGMNSYIVENWGHMEEWDRVFPPLCDEEMLMLFAANEKIWLKLINAFAECCEIKGIIKR